METKWAHKGQIAEYTIWQHKNGVWNLTKDGSPPKNDAGYNSLKAVLRLKGLSRTGAPRFNSHMNGKFTYFIE